VEEQRGPQRKPAKMTDEEYRAHVRRVAAECEEAEADLDAMVAAMPPLTAEQRARLAILLKPTTRT
jgi:hypothetical protein